MPDASGASNVEVHVDDPAPTRSLPIPRRTPSQEPRETLATPTVAGLAAVESYAVQSIAASRIVSPAGEGAECAGYDLESVLGESAVDLDLVIPVYNEEARIGPTLRTLILHLRESDVSARFIVVDNGSVDATAEVVDLASRAGGSVKLISCSARGKGAAVRAGIAAATAPFTGYVDADQSTPPQSLVTALGILRSGWDLVIGSRRALGAEYVVPQPFMRRVGSRAFNLAATPIVGRISDTQCGMKLFRTEAAQAIFAEAAVSGFAFDVEILARARRRGLRAMELPVSWSDSEGSSFSPVRDGIRAFADLRQAHRNLRDVVA